MTAREVEYENVSVSAYADQLAAVAGLSGVDVAKVKGYVLIVDDGSATAVVTTDLAVPDCAALVYQIMALLFGGTS